MSTFCVIVEYDTHAITNYVTGAEHGPTRTVLRDERALKNWLASFKNAGYIPQHGEIRWHLGAMESLEEE